MKKEIKKYSVKPPKDLRSKFEAKVEAKKKAEEEEKERKRREEEHARIAVCFLCAEILLQIILKDNLTSLINGNCFIIILLLCKLAYQASY